MVANVTRRILGDVFRITPPRVREGDEEVTLDSQSSWKHQEGVDRCQEEADQVLR